MSDKSPRKSDYTVLIDGWIAGHLRKAGTTIALSAAEARYELSAGKIAPVAPATEAPATDDGATGSDIAATPPRRRKRG